MMQLSMFHDPLDDEIEEWCSHVASGENWQRHIDLIFDGFQGMSSSKWCYEVRHGLMMYADRLFNWYEPEPYVRKITKEEFTERVKAYL